MTEGPTGMNTFATWTPVGPKLTELWHGVTVQSKPANVRGMQREALPLLRTKVRSPVPARGCESRVPGPLRELPVGRR